MGNLSTTWGSFQIWAGSHSRPLNWSLDGQIISETATNVIQVKVLSAIFCFNSTNPIFAKSQKCKWCPRFHLMSTFSPHAWCIHGRKKAACFKDSVSSVGASLLCSNNWPPVLMSDEVLHPDWAGCEGDINFQPAVHVRADVCVRVHVYQERNRTCAYVRGQISISLLMN